MDEILQKLLEAEVLNEDTKKELEGAFKAKLEEAVEEAKTAASADVKAELTEQWVSERDALVEAIDQKVSDYLEGEVTELKEDIDRFRDLEAEYAEKIVEEKANMSKELKKDLKKLVEQLDAFLEIRLTKEMEELREDLETVKQNDFGRKIFEAFKSEFVETQASDDDSEETIGELRSKLTDTEESLQEAERKFAKLERTIKMQEVLEPLEGRARDIMEAILKNVPTSQLDEGYKTFIGRVLRESDEEISENTSEKEDKVLSESEAETAKSLKEGTTVVTGDKEDTSEAIVEATEHLSEADKLRIRKLAGLM